MALPMLRRNHDHRPTPPPAAAPPARSDMWRDLEELRDRLDKVMDSLWQPLGGALEGGPGWVPAVDVEEADDAWIVEAELPGVQEDDIVLELHGTQLSISGDIQERKRRGILRRSSRRVGHFDYRVNLPGMGEPDDVQATLEHGVLTVRVPKPEHARRRRIAIR